MFVFKIMVAVVLAFGLTTAVSAQSQSLYLVQISDMVKIDGYELMTREEVAALKKAIAEETKAFPVALAAVKKAWDEDELTKKVYFPAALLSARKMREQGPFPQDQALKKKEQAIDRLDKSMYKQMEKKRARGRSEAAKKAAEKETQREQSLADAHEKVREKMKELLEREIPKNGF